MLIKEITKCSAVFLLFAVTGCQKDTPKNVFSPSIGAVDSSKSASPKPVESIKKQYSGPFGLAGGISIEELEKMGFKSVETSPEVFSGMPPKPLDGFKEYFVIALPEIGLCRIRADHNIDVVNGSGDQLKSKADQVAEMMAVKYGKHSTKVVYISKDVYKRNPEFWMLGLKEESVFYAYDWTSGKTQQPLPDDLENIEISARATDIQSGYISIHYTYKNFKDCKSAMKKKQASSL